MSDVDVNDLPKYQKNYSDDGFWNKVKSVAKKAGRPVIKNALLLYYVLKSPDVSAKDKSIIIGALGYLILPVDLVPDFIPLAGYTDDLAALLAALRLVADCVTPEIRQKAERKVNELLG